MLPFEHGEGKSILTEYFYKCRSPCLFLNPSIPKAVAKGRPCFPIRNCIVKGRRLVLYCGIFHWNRK